MGLWVSHDCWGSSYHAFRAWRRNIAEVAGFPLVANLDGPGPDYDLPGPTWDDLVMANSMGEWAEPLPEGADPLIYLLAHSDCDGVIHPEQGRQIATRLLELLPEIRRTTVDRVTPGVSWRTYRYSALFRRDTERFIAGLVHAADAGEDVVFS